MLRLGQDGAPGVDDQRMPERLAAILVQATLREDTSAGTERHSGRAPMQTSDEARPVVIPLRYLHTASASGSKTFVVTGDRIAGAGNCKREAGTTHPQLFTVIRVG